MVKDPEDYTNLRVSVYLKNGLSFEHKDCTSRSISKYENFLSFWDGNSLMCYPLDQIEFFIYHF